MSVAGDGREFRQGSQFALKRDNPIVFVDARNRSGRVIGNDTDAAHGKNGESEASSSKA